MAIFGKPTLVRKQPEMRDGLYLYFDAFFDLNHERSHGMGLTFIPWSKIVNYAVFYEFDVDQTDRLLHHIKAMDSAYIKKLSDEREAKSK